jgi:type I restriction enzyme S subunit
MVVTAFGCSSDFLQYALLSSYLKERQIDLAKTRAAQPHLNAEELGSCFVILPLATEQSAVVAFLDRETAKMDALFVEAKAAIALLQERRSALISAAVTGKIDVRRLVPAEAEAA